MMFSISGFSALTIFAHLATSAYGFTLSPVSRVNQLPSNIENSPLFSSKNEDDPSLSTSSLPNRREAIGKSAQSLASLLLFGTVASNPALADLKYNDGFSTTSQTILLTGSNSGIGFDAAKRMAAQDAGHTIILACRTLQKAKDSANRIKDELGAGCKGTIIARECDLADLNSIDSFVKDLDNVDAVCLNAGIARNTAAKDVLRTKQGFELTIGTNHLGHFYLTNLLLPILDKNQDTGGSRIVVTASGVHDPDSPGGAQGSKATLGDLSGLKTALASGDGVFDMVDGGSYDPDKAYKDSKLCNVFFTRELQRRLNAANKNVVVNSFNPGLIVSTGLFRDQNPIFTKIFDFAATDLLKVGENVHWGGGALEYVMFDEKINSKGGIYYTSPPGSSKYGDGAFGNSFAESEVSKEARDEAKQKNLWDLSETLVGLA